jgi:adenylate kinase family enzyme
VIEGVSRVVRESADLIVFLDYPRWVSFWRCAKRNWRYLFRSRPGLPENCPEIRIVPTLVRIIWQFPKKVRPVLMADFDEWRGTKTVVHIRSDRDLAAFLRRLEQVPGRAEARCNNPLQRTRSRSYAPGARG